MPMTSTKWQLSHVNAIKNSAGMIDVLMKGGANIEARNHDCIPLHEAADSP